MNKIIFCDKNKKLVNKIKELDLTSNFYDFVVSEEDDVFKVKEQYPTARIVTASNPNFNPGGGLDKALATKYPEQWKKAEEFKRTKDLLFTITCNDKFKTDKDIVLRALVGVSGYSYESDIILTGLGTGIAGLEIVDFIYLLNRFISRDFNDAKLNYAKLKYAELNYAKLSNAKLNNAKLSNAKLNNAELNNAELKYAELNNAELNYAKLSNAKLNNAELKYAELNYAELNYAKLSNVVGVLNFSPSEWLEKNFEKTEEGYIVYKAIGNTTYSFSEKWREEEGFILTEVVNSNITNNCGCGVNFGTKEYVTKTYPSSRIWKCLIKWEWLTDVIVPIHTDGKARTRKLMLVEKVR